MRHLFNKYSGHRPIPTYREDWAKRSPKYVLKGVSIISQIAPPQDSTLRKDNIAFQYFIDIKMPGCHHLIRNCQGAPLPTGVCYHLCFWSLEPLMSLFPHLMSDIWPLEWRRNHRNHQMEVTGGHV